MPYDEHDLKMAESMGEVKGLLRSIEKKLIDYHVENSNRHELEQAENDRQHSAMWKKIDTHHRVIYTIVGGIGVVSAIVGLIIHWIKTKMGFTVG